MGETQYFVKNLGQKLGDSKSKKSDQSPLLKMFGRKSEIKSDSDRIWLEEATDVEFLRYLRRSEGRRDVATKAMIEHSKWRTSEHGVNNIIKTGDKRFPPHHPLHREVFWLGIAKDNTATLVVRTQAHDGRDYHEDPNEFVDFIQHVLEKGRVKYKIGSERQVSLLLDRSVYVKQIDDGTQEKIPYQLDISVVPKLLELMKKLFSTLHANYAELLVTAKVVPVSSFFA